MSPLRLLLAASLAGSLLLPSGATAHAPGSVFTGFGTPVMDGVVGADEWASAASLAFEAGLPGGGSVPGELRMMNDSVNVYFAIRVSTTSFETSVALSFDNDHDGIWPEEGSDGLALGDLVAGFFGDLVLSARGGCPATTCGFQDIQLGGTSDGQGLRTIQAAETHIELSHPLDSADDLNDFSVGPEDVLGFAFQVGLCPSGTPGDCVFTRPLDIPPAADLVIARPPPSTPAEALAALAEDVNGVGPGTSLAAKVRAAEQALAAGEVTPAIRILDAFAAEVNAQSGKQIPPATAEALLGAVASIKSALAQP